jgi:hypothetical protein
MSKNEQYGNGGAANGGNNKAHLVYARRKRIIRLSHCRT